MAHVPRQKFLTWHMCHVIIFPTWHICHVRNSHFFFPSFKKLKKKKGFQNPIFTTNVNFFSFKSYLFTTTLNFFSILLVSLYGKKN
jgi:hypothetical protein